MISAPLTNPDQPPGHAGRRASRPLADDLPRIDVALLRKWRVLLPEYGAHYWAVMNAVTGIQRRSAEQWVAVWVESDHLLVRQADTNLQLERIDILRTPCTFGGSRPWLSCPGCQSRVGVLYVAGERIRCRRCIGAAYRSQRLDECSRSWQRQRRIEARLGENQNRPPGMHWGTYERLLRGLQWCKHMRTRWMMKSMGRYTAQDKRDFKLVRRFVCGRHAP